MQHLLAGVSATALTVAAARAIASDAGDASLDDPFAALFVRASGHAELPVRIEDAAPDARDFWRRLARYLAARTLAFDGALLDAAREGCAQVVIVAAGLDARAYRVDWRAGVSIYEIDRDPVLAFKQRVLDEAGARPRAHRIPIASDVAHDWPSALTDHGFDAQMPTAWLVEGLLPYLPGDLETSLVERIDALSAPGSRLALEFIERPEDPASLPMGTAQITALFDAGDRPDTRRFLTSRGWDVETRAIDSLASWSFARR